MRAFSVPSLWTACKTVSRSVLLGMLRGQGEEVATRGGPSMSCKDGASASSLTLPVWQQETGSSAFLPPCKWWHSGIHMFNETITLLVIYFRVLWKVGICNTIKCYRSLQLSAVVDQVITFLPQVFSPAANGDLIYGYKSSWSVIKVYCISL